MLDTAGGAVRLAGAMKKTTKSPTVPRDGLLLGAQPDAEPVFYTHFACWPGEPESEYTKQENADARACLRAGTIDAATLQLVRRLLAEWSAGLHAQQKGKAAGFYVLHGLYPLFGHDAFMAACAEVFVRAGFAVYLSETMLEVYPLEVIGDEDLLQGAEDDERAVGQRWLKVAQYISGLKESVDDALSFAEGFEDFNGPDARFESWAASLEVPS